MAKLIIADVARAALPGARHSQGDPMPPRAPRPMGRHILWVLVLISSLASAACPSHQHARTQVVLTWDYPHPALTSDGFLIQRRTGTGPWQDVARVAAPLRTGTDATAPRNTPLCYQVLAYRGREYSAPSNEVCLTIPAGPQPRARTSPEEELMPHAATGPWLAGMAACWTRWSAVLDNSMGRVVRTG
jgi:hypothetical protein